MAQLPIIAKRVPAVQTMRYRDDRSQMGQNPHVGQAQQQEELIRYIYDSWHKVSKEVEHCSQNNGAENGKGGTLVTYYYESEPNPMLKDFQPFDLDAWSRMRSSTARNLSSA